MGLFRRTPKSPEERQAALEKWQKRIDPAAANGHASVLDGHGGAAGRIRKATRDYEILREQKETNRLLREQAARDLARDQHL